MLLKNTAEKEKPASEGGQAWIRIECTTESRKEIHMVLSTPDVYEKVLGCLLDLTED